MAAGHTAREDRTRLPNGLEQLLFCAVPGAAGNLVCTGVKLATDKLVSVLCITLATTAVISAAALYTDEFLPDTNTSCLASPLGIYADDTIDNTGGTATTGKMVLVTISRAR
jgi:hypothetical protein